MKNPLRLIFPDKNFPEDNDSFLSFLARFVLAAGLVLGLWSGWQLYHWARSSTFVPTSGFLDYGTLQSVPSGITDGYYSYTVDGVNYSSRNIAFGGRPLGTIAPEGVVMVYYDPQNPGFAVLEKRPVEIVFAALLFALASPFLARWIWDKYV